MNILLFGATGFIGKQLTERLLNKGYSITVVSRNPEKADQTFTNKVNTFKLEYNDIDKLSEIISNHDFIINLAGENIASKLWTKNQKQKILNSRVKLGAFITEAVSKALKKPQLLVQGSAIGYYGFQTQEACTEKSPRGAGFLAEVTEKWEKSTQPIEKIGVKRIVIRTGVVLGKGNGILPKLIAPIKLYLGANFGQGNNYIPWIHIEDEIRAIEFLISNEQSEGIYNLVAPHPVKSKKLNEAIARELKRPLWLTIPTLLIKLLLRDMGKELLLANQEVYPVRLQTENFYFSHPSIEKTIESLI